MGTDNDIKPWQDATRPVAERVASLLAEMSLEEKAAQLYAVWVGVQPDGADVAPHQHDLTEEIDFPTLIQQGLGQLTRPFGTAKVDPTDGAKALARLQSEISAANRFGIPALVHEECLTGFMTWQATLYPTPLAWGATFHPELVEQMAAQIGAGMRGVGVHQGLAPVLDVVRDPRWGRTEETMGEDPYLVATVGTAYVRGLQAAGVIATLKHFAGYSSSQAARNLGPAPIGPREFADVLLPPFEMAVRDGEVGSIMPSYSAVDRVPSHADRRLLTELLREEWGFTGTVVSDYFGVTFLQMNQGVAGNPTEAAARALTAGLDVELPGVRCYGEPLITAVREGRIDESLVDRAVTRVLTQKCELGLLDPDWSPLPPALRESDPAPGVDLDPPAAQQLARRLAEESVVLLSNQLTLPLRPDARIAVVGPLADDPLSMLGCYAFPNHVGRNEIGGTEHDTPATDTGIGSVLAGLRTELPDAAITHVPGGQVTSTDWSTIDTAVRAAARADVCVAVVGDRAGLFGRGTSGEGCDVGDLRLPGQQEQLLAALAETGTPVVAVLLTGRPYALGAIVDRLGAIVQAFFPGQAGGEAVAGVLSGRVNPSGRLPVSVPREPGGQPTTYLAPPLGQHTEVSAIDPTPLFPFGYGRSYTTFAWDEVQVDGAPHSDEPVTVPTDGAVTVSVRVRNAGDREGVEVVQLYLHDPVAQVTQPVVRLIGYARVPLAPDEARRVSFRVPTDLSAFTGLTGQRVVEPGRLELRLGTSSTETPHVVAVDVVGPEREVDHRRHLTPEVTIS